LKINLLNLILEVELMSYWYFIVLSKICHKKSCCKHETWNFSL